MAKKENIQHPMGRLKVEGLRLKENGAGWVRRAAVWRRAAGQARGTRMVDGRWRFTWQFREYRKQFASRHLVNIYD